jgi:hypothetical protein
MDPNVLQYYRINFDGTGLVPITTADANHEVAFSDDHQFYVDFYSRVDSPGVVELRRTSDRSLVFEVERGDISALVKSGWKAPEPFVAKGRDGTTDIWGLIYRPRQFDPAKKYPVIEYIYAGPHGSHVAKSFSAFNPVEAQAVVRHHACRHLRRVRRRPELDGGAALPPGVLQGSCFLCRLPRQPHGQDLVERAVDGMAHRFAVLALVERGQRGEAAGEDPARRR